MRGRRDALRNQYERLRSQQRPLDEQKPANRPSEALLSFREHPHPFRGRDGWARHNRRKDPLH